jgi:hypothetical protein
MEFHQTQDLVAKSTSRYRVVDCGRQWGKTTLAIWEMLGLAYSKDNQVIKYFATTIDQARDIAWGMLKQYAENIIIDKNETRLELILKTQNDKTSTIKLGGYENIETERGKQNDFIVLDEAASMKNFKYNWEAVIEPTLAFRKGSALFISTPKGFNDFFQLYEKGQRRDIEWESWKFTSFDNPFLDNAWLEQRRLSTTPEFFSQEYLADFTRFTGLIYQEFDSSIHVEPFDHTFNDHADYLFGLDFAVRGYTASLPLKIKPDGNIYILDNYKQEGKTAKEHREAIKQMLLKYTDFSNYNGYADPAGWMRNQQDKDMIWSIADEYIEADFPIVPANNQVTPGINYVKQLFRENKIHIHSRCTLLIEELLQYQWKDYKQVGEESEPERPRKINDHLVDCLRYALYSKPDKPEAEVKPTGKVFPIEFPLRIDPEPEGDKYTEIDIPSFIE